MPSSEARSKLFSRRKGCPAPMSCPATAYMISMLAFPSLTFSSLDRKPTWSNRSSFRESFDMTGRRSSSPRALARVLFPEAGIPVTNMQYIGSLPSFYIRHFNDRPQFPALHQEILRDIAVCDDKIVVNHPAHGMDGMPPCL